MKDRSLDILIMIFFGVSGITILLLAWLKPMMLPDKLLAAGIGSVGVFYAGMKATRSLTHRGVSKGENLVAAEIEDRF